MTTPSAGEDPVLPALRYNRRFAPPKGSRWRHKNGHEYVVTGHGIAESEIETSPRVSVSV